MDTHRCNNLLEASYEGHDACIRALVEAGEDLNAVTGWWQDTPLHDASLKGHESCVRILIAAGADLDVPNCIRWTPLFYAAFHGNDSCALALIIAGANPNVVDICGTTPLHLATKGGHSVIVQKLVDAGANPNVDDKCGMTPLHLAAFNGCVTIVEMLITAKANPDVINAAGTPLQLAVEKGHKKCAEVLAVHILAERSLTDDEWDFVPKDSDIGHLLPVVMARDGRDAVAKLVSKLPEEQQKILETIAMCLSRFIARDVAEQILVRCV